MKKNYRENSRYPENLYVSKISAFTYGENSLKALGPKIWNSLPSYFKKKRSLDSFKKLMSTWDGATCQCIMCNKLNNPNF